MASRLKPIRSELAARPVRLVLRVGALVVVLVVLANYQFVLDQYALATYHAPANIAPLEAKLGLTKRAQAIFDRAQPQIDDKSAFNKDCQTQKGDLELGCYTHDRIYILQIDNASLQPEMETVLAHEVLHAAWDRLSARDRSELGSQLEDVYHGLNNPDLSARMAGYATSEPGEETNELHSILGTEEATLPADLTAHYDEYFTDRGAIVAAHAAYQHVFDTRRDQLVAQLGTIKSLKAQLAAIDARLAADRASNQISSYNALIPSQNRLVDEVNSLITSYDDGVDEYNALSASIDSQQLSTEPGV